jgi:hypothetical protein
MNFITQRLILGFGVQSSIYLEYNTIKGEILFAFNMDLPDVSAKKLLQKQWGIQTNTKCGLQKAIF